ncbi:MAG: ABC transporter substrate-binding protein, partial [Chloroflexi bacterium]|nr:ABC transporter substrate-binding protein [Chloroflexota bacterium]
MRIKQATSAAVLALAALLFAAGGCAPAVSPTSIKAIASSPIPAAAGITMPAGPYGELRVAVATFGREKFELPVMAATDLSLADPMFDVMLWQDKGQLTPGVVEDYVMAPDALSWTLHVRKGVMFHNGDEVDARDIKFSLEQYMRPDSLQPMMRNGVSKIEIVDARTVRVSTRGPQPYFPTWITLGSPQQGAVMPKSYIEARGWPYASANPVGTGPFRFSKHVPGDMVQFEAVNSHWRMVPSFKKLTIVLVPEESTRVASLKTGAVDIIETNLDSLLELQSMGFQTPVVDQVGIGSMFYGTYDQRAANAAVSDIRVRKALAISINRDEIRKKFFRGLGGPAMPVQTTTATLEIDVPYWEKYFAAMYKYDPEQAKQLLKEAGYPNGGFPVILYAHPISGTPWLPQLSEVIAGYWRKIGVDAKVVPVDYGTLQTWRKPLADPLVGAHAFMRYPSGAPAIRGLDSTWGSQG